MNCKKFIPKEKDELWHRCSENDKACTNNKVDHFVPRDEEQYVQELLENKSW